MSSTDNEPSNQFTFAYDPDAAPMRQSTELNIARWMMIGQAALVVALLLWVVAGPFGLGLRGEPLPTPEDVPEGVNVELFRTIGLAFVGVVLATFAALFTLFGVKLPKGKGRIGAVVTEAVATLPILLLVIFGSPTPGRIAFTAAGISVIVLVFTPGASRVFARAKVTP